MRWAIEGLDFDELEGVSPAFVEALYRATDRSRTRRAELAQFSRARRHRQGPSWARANWPLSRHRRADRRARSDPDASSRQGRAKARRRARPRAARARPTIGKAAADSIRAMMLIRTYRVRGHLAADLDPLGLAKRELPADLTPEYHGFTGADLDRPVYLGGTLGLEKATVREIVDDPARQLLRQCRPRIYAHRRRRGAPLPAGADGGQGQGDPASRPRARRRSSPR